MVWFNHKTRKKNNNKPPPLWRLDLARDVTSHTRCWAWQEDSDLPPASRELFGSMCFLVDETSSWRRRLAKSSFIKSNTSYYYRRYPKAAKKHGFNGWKWWNTKWFKVTFWSPSWRSQPTVEFGSLNLPNKVTKNCQEYLFKLGNHFWNHLTETAILKQRGVLKR